MFHFAQIALWAFLVVLMAAVNAAPRYFIIDDGEEGNKEIYAIPLNSNTPELKISHVINSRFSDGACPP
jgi:hypothetical protein